MPNAESIAQQEVAGFRRFLRTVWVLAGGHEHGVLQKPAVGARVVPVEALDEGKHLVAEVGEQLLRLAVLEPRLAQVVLPLLEDGRSIGCRLAWISRAVCARPAGGAYSR